jgi:hypothetical protein
MWNLHWTGVRLPSPPLLIKVHIMELENFKKLSNYKQKEYVKALLKDIRTYRDIEKTGKYILEGEEKEIMLYVISKHPTMRSDMKQWKSENVKDIMVKLNPKAFRYKTTRVEYCYGYHAVYEDGIIEDFSYHIIFDQKKKHAKRLAEYAESMDMQISDDTKNCIAKYKLQAIPLNAENVETFLIRQDEAIKTEPMVYFLWENGEIVYIGKTANKVQRLLEHHVIQASEYCKTYISTIKYNDCSECDLDEKKYIRVVTDNNLFELKNKMLYKSLKL